MQFDALFMTSSLKRVPSLAQAAERLGFDGLWMAETAHNPFLPLTLAAAHTSRLSLGTAVAIAFPRSPMVTAQIAWDLADQSDGRFILGLGTQIKAHVTRRFSSVWDSPGPRLREYILALRVIWDTFQTNAPLRFKGEFYTFTLMTPFFTPGPIKAPAIPIYIAGVNTHLCRLAGELCQGFHVHSFHTPRYLREVIIPNIEQGAASASRTRADVRLNSAIFVVTGKDEQEIENNKAPVKQQIAFYGSTPSYQTVFELHGWQNVGEALTLRSKQGRWSDMADLITDDILHEFAIVAPHDQLARRVRERYAGLLDRIGYYHPFEPGVMDEVWQDAVSVLSDKSSKPH